MQYACTVFRHTAPSPGVRGDRALVPIEADGTELGVPFISSIPNSSTPPAFFQYHPHPTILSGSIFSVHKIIMASQKMALLAVAAGLLCMSALLNGAEASVSAGHQQQLEIDTSVHS